VKYSSWSGLVALRAGSMDLKTVMVEDCQSVGVYARGGGKFDATGCQFHHNGNCGVNVNGSTMTARLTNCKGTSVHDNEKYGLYACYRGATINVYQPCVLNDMSYGNKRQNIGE